MCVGVIVRLGWGGVVSLCRLKLCFTGTGFWFEQYKLISRQFFAKQETLKVVTPVLPFWHPVILYSDSTEHTWQLHARGRDTFIDCSSARDDGLSATELSAFFFIINLRKSVGWPWAGLIWLSIRRNGWLLWTRYWPSGVSSKVLLISDCSSWSELVTWSGYKPPLPQHKISPDNIAFIELAVCSWQASEGCWWGFVSPFLNCSHWTVELFTFYVLITRNSIVGGSPPFFLFC
jgi:hypothetical protein